MVRKLLQLGIPEATIKEIKKDIFRDPLQLELGLVDSVSEEDLDRQLSSLKVKWDSAEEEFNSPPEFHTWCLEFSRDGMAKLMIRPVRGKAGIGSPPEPYYTNDIESTS